MDELKEVIARSDNKDICVVDDPVEKDFKDTQPPGADYGPWANAASLEATLTIGFTSQIVCFLFGAPIYFDRRKGCFVANRHF